MSEVVLRLASLSLFLLVLITCNEGGAVCEPTPTNPCGPEGSISGSVLDNGLPLFGATVTASGPADTTGTTDGNGSFTFTGLPGGNYTLTLSSQPGSCQDSEGFSRAATVTDGGSAVADFALNCSNSWTAISAGRLSCGIRSTGRAYCWGRGTTGALGNGFMSDVGHPSAVALAAPFVQVEPIFNSSCGLTGTGLFCWGENTDGGLGTGNSDDSNTPQPVQSGASFASIGDGGCALDNGGVAYCWGLNDRGQVGDGTTDSRNVPTQVSGGHTFTAIGSGERHGCGIAGDTWCWGDNQRGQLGQGATSGNPELTPVVVPTGPDYEDIAVGREFNCGLTAAGEIWCWGRNIDGQIGQAPSAQVAAPTQVGSSSNWTAVTAGARHACAIQGSQAYCWGDGAVGQLGNGSFDDTFTPTPVAGGLSFSQIDAGNDHTCGLVGGVAYCWGNNDNGEIGDGTESVRAEPTQVIPAPQG